jgi:hypothetical protein
VCRSIVHDPYTTLAEGTGFQQDVQGLTNYCDLVGTTLDPRCRCIGKGMQEILTKLGIKEPDSLAGMSLYNTAAPCLDPACSALRRSGDALLARLLKNTDCNLVINQCDMGTDMENNSIGRDVILSCNFGTPSTTTPPGSTPTTEPPPGNSTPSTRAWLLPTIIGIVLACLGLVVSVYYRKTIAQWWNKTPVQLRT